MKRFTIILIALLLGTLLWGQPTPDDPEELIFWDFQNTLEPEEVNWYIARASNIRMSEGEINFMNGTDGGNSLIGWAPDTLWSTETALPDPLPSKYIEYTFRPRWDYAVHLNEFQFRFGRNELGPRAFAVAISADDFETGQWILSDEIESEDPNDLDFFMEDLDGAFFRFSGPNRRLSIRIWFWGAIEDEDDEIDPDDEETWPTLFMNNFVVTGYIVPFPAMALLLDRTGSMGEENFGLRYWVPAKQTARVFIGSIMQNLDAVSLITYCVEDMESTDWEDHVNVDWPMLWPNNKISQLWPNPTVPDSIVQRVHIIDEIDDLDDPIGRTSIGAALYAGREELIDAYGRKPGKAAMILLSDGFDNWNPMARHAVPNIPDSMSVFTVTIGNIADANLMRWIARETGGLWVHAPNEELLTELYWYIYLMGVEQLDISSTSYQTIAANERHIEDVIVDNKMGQVTFQMVTEETDTSQQTTSVGFTLISPSGLEINSLVAQETAGITYSETFAGKKYEIFLPEKGVWQYVVSGNNIPEEENYFAIAYGPSSIKLEIDTVDEEYTVGEPVVFEAKLRHRHSPIASAQVKAFVTPATEDTRNRSYSNVEGTPFADYEPEKTINTRFERTRNPGEIEVNFVEVEPGIYRGVLEETEIAGSYNARLIASADNEEFHFSRHSFHTTLVSPPERVPIPHLAYPADGAEDLGTEVEFVWNDVLVADSYQFQIATQQEIIIDIEGIQTNSIIIDSLDYDMDYVWRVKAYRGEEDSYWSGIWSFSTGLPEIPVPHNLEGSLENDGVYLNWNPVAPDHHFYGDLFGYLIFRNDNLLVRRDESTTTYRDRHAIPGNTYTYYVKSVYDLVGQWTSEPSNTIEIRVTGIEDEDVPLATGIRGNYPNPFNPETTVMFSLTEPGFTEISVYNITGQKVRTLVRERLDAGNHSVVWNALDERDNPATSGIYMIKMETENYSGHSKVLLLK